MINIGKLTAEETLNVFVESGQALTEEQLFDALETLLTSEQKGELAAQWEEK